MAKPQCLICWSRLSKRERKIIEATRASITNGKAVLNICSDCTTARARVASKMKRS